MGRTLKNILLLRQAAERRIERIIVEMRHLLYFIIKDHPFADGNKRIGSFLFIYFLDKNNYL